MLRYSIFIEHGLLPDLTVGVLISASRSENTGLLLRESADQKAHRELQVPNVAPPDSENYPHHSGENSAASGLAELGRP